MAMPSPERIEELRRELHDTIMDEVARNCRIKLFTLKVNGVDTIIAECWSSTGHLLANEAVALVSIPHDEDPDT